MRRCRTLLWMWFLLGCGNSGAGKDCPPGTHSEDGACVEAVHDAGDSGLDTVGDADADTDADADADADADTDTDTDTDTDSGLHDDTASPEDAGDRDNDGYRVSDGDCDDLDDTVYPGAEEVWYDGIDSDCDGASDFDADGDGHDAESHGGDDCDDGVATTHPGAEEVWYDGVDGDCAGDSDFDADSDGDDDSAYGGGDCLDTDASIYTGAPESCDAVDSDCDGSLVDDTWGDHDGDGLPDCVDPDAPDILHGGEWRWDGVVDAGAGLSIVQFEGMLLIGSPSVDGGVVYVQTDMAGGVHELESTAVAVRAVDEGVGLGKSVVGINSSTGRKLVVGLRDASAVAVLTMPTDETSVSLSDWGDPKVVEGDSGSFCGHELAAGKLFGTEEEGVLASCPNTYDGAQLVSIGVLESARSGVDLMDLGYRVGWGIDDSDDVGLHIEVTDFNGDGMDDAIVGSPKADFTGRNSGAVHVYLGPFGEDRHYSDHDAVVRGDRTEDFLGGGFTGQADVTGDGTRELVILQGTGPETWDSADGSVHLFSASTLSGGTSREASDAYASLYTSASDSWEVSDVAVVDDLDGDGTREVLIGVPLSDAGGIESGALILLSGRVEGTLDLDEVSVAHSGEAGSRLGRQLATADLNADGVDELLVSAHGASQVYGIPQSVLWD